MKRLQSLVDWKTFVKRNRQRMWRRNGRSWRRSRIGKQGNLSNWNRNNWPRLSRKGRRDAWIPFKVILLLVKWRRNHWKEFSRRRQIEFLSLKSDEKRWWINNDVIIFEDWMKVLHLSILLISFRSFIAFQFCVLPFQFKWRQREGKEEKSERRKGREIQKGEEGLECLYNCCGQHF